MRKYRLCKLISAIGLIAFTAGALVFQSKLDISLVDAFHVVAVIAAGPLALVLMYEGLALLYGLVIESAADADRP